MIAPHRNSLPDRYLRFAEEEAFGRSPLYEAFARAVAEDRDTLEFLETMPPDKQQPNLLFAAVRHLCGLATDWPGFHRMLLDNADSVRAFMLTHSTQTNEPARCATLLPVLARLPQPLALIEVGAAAGLCLFPDLYGYDYGSREVRPDRLKATHPVFTCDADAATPIPVAMPRIVWRAGLDLNPLDAADPTQAAWLETLVWPEQERRLANLRAALRIAALLRPRIAKGNLLGTELASLSREAPRDATLVIFHTAVLAYVPDQADRRTFAQRARSLSPYWICNEARGVFPEFAERAGTPGAAGRFLLSVNGRPTAWTDPHGAALEWVADVIGA
jgi:hypothetical protein